MSKRYMSSINISVIIMEDTMFSQETLMPKSHSNDKDDKISAHLPINVSNDVKSFPFTFITYIQNLYHTI